MHYIKTDDAGRLTAWAAAGFHCGEGEIAMTMPEDFDPEHVSDWVLSDGALIYDPLPIPEPPIGMDQRLDEVEMALMELAALIGGESV